MGKRYPNRTRFDASVDRDLLAAARAKKAPGDTWPQEIERLLRFIEAEISIKELVTSLDLAVSALEQEITSEYNVGSKRHKAFLEEWKGVKELVRRAKWAEHSRI